MKTATSMTLGLAALCCGLLAPLPAAAPSGFTVLFQTGGQPKDCIGTTSCTPNRECARNAGTCYIFSPGEDPVTENANGDGCGCYI